MCMLHRIGQLCSRKDGICMVISRAGETIASSAKLSAIYVTISISVTYIFVQGNFMNNEW